MFRIMATGARSSQSVEGDPSMHWTYVLDALELASRRAKFTLFGPMKSGLKPGERKP
jgi:hypothetical protein